MLNFEEAVLKEIAGDILKDIDKKALAKKLRPLFQKRLEKALLSYYNEDYMFEALANSKLDKIFDSTLQHVIDSITKGLK